MALEIQEIGIRLRVEDSPAMPQGFAAHDEQKPAKEEEPCGCSENDREGIVEDCVRRVLWALDAFGQR